MVGLEVELVECWQELCHCADTLVCHVDAVVDGEGDETGVERRPKTLLGDKSGHKLNSIVLAF